MTPSANLASRQQNYATYGRLQPEIALSRNAAYVCFTFAFAARMYFVVCIHSGVFRSRYLSQIECLTIFSLPQMHHTLPDTYPVSVGDDSPVLRGLVPSTSYDNSSRPNALPFIYEASAATHAHETTDRSSTSKEFTDMASAPYEPWAETAPKYTALVGRGGAP